MFPYALPLFLLCCLALGGCSLVAGTLMPTDSPVMSKNAQPMFRHIIERDRDRCRGGYYKGVDVENLRDHVDKRWSVSTHPGVPGKYYTFKYFDHYPGVFGSTNWYEYWYQLHDYDLDGKIDECKYYEVFKGNVQPLESLHHKEFMEQFNKELEDYDKRHGLKF